MRTLLIVFIVIVCCMGITHSNVEQDEVVNNVAMKELTRQIDEAYNKAIESANKIVTVILTNIIKDMYEVIALHANKNVSYVIV